MKNPFIAALDADLPEGVASFLETPFGEIPEIDIPSSKDDAIIACGKLSAHLNNFLLMPFSGLTPVELLLRIGQKNPVLISSMLAGLEVITGGGGKFEVIIPAEGGVYPNFFEILCSGQGISSIDVALGDDTTSLTEIDAFWKGSFPTPLMTGKHQAAFVATFEDDSTETISVNFETTANMELVATYPKDETSYRPEEIDHISVTLSAEAAAENESLTATVFGQVFTLIKSGAEYAADPRNAGVAWLGLNVMVIKDAAEAVLGEISFMIEGDGGGDEPEA